MGKRVQKERPSVKRNKRTTWKWRGRRTRKVFVRSFGPGPRKSAVRVSNELNGGQGNDCEYHSSTRPRPRTQARRERNREGRDHHPRYGEREAARGRGNGRRRRKDRKGTPCAARREGGRPDPVRQIHWQRHQNRRTGVPDPPRG